MGVKAKPPCTHADGCEKQSHARGLCHGHYGQWLAGNRHLLAVARRYAAHVLERSVSPAAIADLVDMPPESVPDVERQVHILIGELRRVSDGVAMPEPLLPEARMLRGRGPLPWTRETRIEELPLLTRTRNGLLRSGYKTVGDVLALTDWDLGDMRYFGAESIRDLRRALFPSDPEVL